MSAFVCLDSSVLIKLLTWEEGSEVVAELMEQIVENGQTVVVPDFAWVEVGSVLRQKVKRKEITSEEAGEAWRAFRHLKVLNYLEEEEVMDTAWRISVEEDLPTLYDAAYLAVAELATRKSKEGVCEFWTADQRLANTLSGVRKYIRLLTEFMASPGSSSRPI